MNVTIKTLIKNKCLAWQTMLSETHARMQNNVFPKDLSADWENDRKREERIEKD